MEEVVDAFLSDEPLDWTDVPKESMSNLDA